MIKIHRIQRFIAVAEHGGFRKAAQELALSQPALSVDIRTLEEELGISLLRRTTRNVRLTSDGEMFLARAQRILGDLDATISEIRERAAIQRGRAVVAAVPSIAASVLPKVVAAFNRRYPNIDIKIWDDRAEVIERLVERSQVDFSIGPPPVRRTELKFSLLVDDPFIALVPREHPLGRATSVTVKQIAQYPLISMRRGLNMRLVLEQAFRKSKIALRPKYEVQHHDTLAGLVAAGLGIGILPAMTVSIVRLRELAMARITGPVISRRIGLITRRGEGLSASARKFVEMAREMFAEASNGKS